MSWSCAALFRRSTIGVEPWEHLFDTLDEAAAHMAKAADSDTIAFEIDSMGQPTGIVLRYDPAAAAFLKSNLPEDDP